MHLRKSFPTLRFAVAGLGRPGGALSGIEDRRVASPSALEEREWCQLYADSQIIVGVHGSNMLLPSAHAGAVVELMPSERWGNALQDLLFRGEDERLSLLRHRLIPIETHPTTVAALIKSMLIDYDGLSEAMTDRPRHPEKSY
jgi:hypothetical protein